jgi:hypothetical protein
MFTHRWTFLLDDATARQVERLCQQYGHSRSDFLRTVLAIVLAEPQSYHEQLNAHVLRHYAPPSPEQQAAFEVYRTQLEAVDLEAICATLPPPP